MVRSITGTIIEMGLGRRRAGEMLGILRSGDRANAGRVAPPEGLTLWEVRYDGVGPPVEPTAWRSFPPNPTQGFALGVGSP